MANSADADQTLHFAVSNLVIQCLLTPVCPIACVGVYGPVNHCESFVSSPREREKRDRKDSRGDEVEGQGRKRNRNKSEETEK